MTINQLRLLIGLLFLPILISHSYSLFYYMSVLWLSVEFLNRQKNYTDLSHYQLFNGIFGAYLFFIILKRTANFQWGDFTEGVVNIAEHVFFALVICLKIQVYLSLFTKKKERQKGVLSILVFNFVGVVNEIFQNLLSHRTAFVFIEDAQKDLIVNGLGSLAFGVFLFLGTQYFTKSTHLSD